MMKSHDRGLEEEEEDGWVGGRKSNVNIRVLVLF